MFLIFDLLVDAAILTLVLTLVGKVNVFDDFMKPLAVILYSSVISLLAAFILGDLAWGIPYLVIKFAAFYFLIGYFFDLTAARRWLVIASCVVLRLLASLLFV